MTMPALNARLNARNTNRNNAGQGGSIMGRIGFGTTVAAVMGFLAVKERWDARTTRGAPQLPIETGAGLANPPPYHDDPDADDIGLDDNVQTRLLDQTAPARPVRSRKRGCCVCCGIRCDIVFKALGIVIALYFFYGVYKVIRWATTSSPTGLEGMPEYSTSLGCTSAPYPYAPSHFDLGIPTDETEVLLDLTGGAVGTVLFAQSDTNTVIVKMDLRTDEEPLLEKVSASANENATSQTSAFRLTTPSSASSSNACMRFDLIIQIPSNLRILSLKSQSLVHVKYDEPASLALSDLNVDLLSPAAGNLLLPHEHLTAARTTLKMRAGYLVGSLAFLESADISTRRGSAVTNLKVTPLPAPASAPDSPAHLTTSAGAGRTDVTYSNPERRVINSGHSSTGGEMYLTYKQAGYNGRVDVQARSRTSTGLEGTMSRPPSESGANELPWVGDKDGSDNMKVRTTGWVGLYF